MMGNNITEYNKVGHFNQRMDELLKKNKEYEQYKEKYCDLLQKIKEQLSCKGQNNDLCMKLDEVVGECSSSYGNAAYTLGFHDGMISGHEHKGIVSIDIQEEKKLGLSMEDMTNLICIHDAYRELNAFLHGEEIALTFDEGVLGKMGRIYNVINNHVSPKFNKYLTNSIPNFPHFTRFPQSFISENQPISLVFALAGLKQGKIF